MLCVLDGFVTLFPGCYIKLRVCYVCLMIIDVTAVD